MCVLIENKRRIQVFYMNVFTTFLIHRGYFYKKLLLHDDSGWREEMLETVALTVLHIRIFRF